MGSGASKKKKLEEEKKKAAEAAAKKEAEEKQRQIQQNQAKEAEAERLKLQSQQQEDDEDQDEEEQQNQQFPTGQMKPIQQNNKNSQINGGEIRNQEIQIRGDDVNELSRELGRFTLNTKIGSEADFGDEISAIYSEEEVETQEQKAERIFSRIQKVNSISQRTQLRLGWPGSGECEVMSVKFKVVYSHLDCDLKLSNSYDIHTISTLSWEANQELKVYDFLLQDKATFNASTSTRTNLPNNIISFVVSPTGDFVCIKEEQDFLKKMRKNQTIINNRTLVKQKNDPGSILKTKVINTFQSPEKELKDKVLNQAEIKVKQLWTKSILECVDACDKEPTEKKPKKKKKKKQQQPLIDGENPDETPTITVLTQGEETDQPPEQNLENIIMFNGFECDLIEKNSIETREKLEGFLKDRLQNDEKFFNQCFKDGKKLMKDKLKMWDIFEDDEFEGNELIPSKFRFPTLRKHDKTVALVQQRGSFARPHIIKTDICKVIVIDHKRDLFVDVSHELKLLMFLWPEREKAHNENTFYQQLGQFKEECDEALKLLTLDLFKARALPLSYKPKLKKKYFELY